MRILDKAKQQLIVVWLLLYAVAISQSNLLAQTRPPKVSPFTKVQFLGNEIRVELQDSNYRWLAIDGVTTTAIVEHAKAKHRSRWQKRIAEDLVELLGEMGHKPKKTVNLKLMDKKSQNAIFKTIEMTHENRQRIVANQPYEAQLSDPAKAVQFFHDAIRERWSYYPISKKQIDRSLADLKNRLACDPSSVDLALELQQVIAQGIDGHASVSGWELQGNCLPFLIEPVGNRFVAFKPDRISFVDDAHPFIDSIDGRSIHDWCAAASTIVPKGSTQYVTRHALRHLRVIDHWRAAESMPIRETVRVTLSGKQNSKRETSLKTVKELPLYGTWPDRRSRFLTGNIGYLRIPKMDRRAEQQIRRVMTAFRNSKGLIVDVRGNGGGSRAPLRLLFSYLMKKDDLPRVTNCGAYRLGDTTSDDHLEARHMYRSGSSHWNTAEKSAIARFESAFRSKAQFPRDLYSERHLFILSRLNQKDIYWYDKPVVVLMDAKCFSATDIFLAGLKGWRNVTLVGTSSGGGSAFTQRLEIPYRGLNARIGSMVSFQPNGELFDGNGVHPDIQVYPNPGFFIDHGDHQLDLANQVIQTQATQ